MRTLLAVTMIALLAATAPGFAQQKTKDDIELAKRQRQREEQARDNAYKSALDKVPNKEANPDPWGTMRSSGTPTAKGK